MARIFISYASPDRPFAEQLAQGLAKRGHEPFFDSAVLRPGQAWQDILAKGLRDADAVLLLVSQASSASSWVFMEAGAAFEYWRQRGRPLVLPVILDNANIPGPLQQIQAIIAPDRDVEVILNAVDLALGRQMGQREAKEEVRERVERNAAHFISGSLNELRSREKVNRRIAYVWYSSAYIFLLVGIGYGFFRATELSKIRGDWAAVGELFVLSLIVVGFLGAAAKLSFMLGKGFMVEALRSADRIHAISFGEFYLNAFGEHAEWEQVREAFQHWNIDRGSSFISQATTDFDPQVMALAIEFAKAVAKAKGGDEKAKE